MGHVIGSKVDVGIFSGGAPILSIVFIAFSVNLGDSHVNVGISIGLSAGISTFAGIFACSPQSPMSLFFKHLKMPQTILEEFLKPAPPIGAKLAFRPFLPREPRQTAPRRLIASALESP